MEKKSSSKNTKQEVSSNLDNLSNSESIRAEGPIADGRRKAVRTILAGSGITAAATTGGWSKPIVDAMILPAHAQTSAVAAVLAGNVDLAPLASNTAPKMDSLLDLFVAPVYAQESGPDLSGACLILTVNGEQFDLEVEFFSDPKVTISGTLSGESFTGSNSGITVTGTLVFNGAASSASGTVENSGGSFNFNLDSATTSCEPIAPTTTPAPTTTAAGTTTTTTASGSTTTTTAAGTTTTTTAAP